MYGNYPDWYRTDTDRRMRDRLPDRACERIIRSDIMDEISLLESRLAELYDMLEELD